MGKSAKIWSPFAGFQEQFVRSNVDIVIGGGAMSSGKSLSAILLCAEPLLDPKSKILFLRNNLGNIKAGGGLVDEVSNVYNGLCDIRQSGIPSAVFPAGSRIDFNHTAEQQDHDKFLEKVKGWQYDVEYADEMTGYEWRTFGILLSRNRGSANWTGKFRGTCNPKKSHWLRTYLDWYIDAQGEIIDERNGVVRYLFLNGENVEDIVWGSTKREVYEQCGREIDERVAIQNKQAGNEVIKWKDLILSSVFYKGTIAENKALVNRDSGYIGKIGMMGLKRAKANLGGNWNVDPDELQDLPITQEVGRRVFTNDSMATRERWITVDVAEEGTNNTLILAWQGFEVVDMDVFSKATPKQNAERTLVMAEKHQVGNGNIIYDATRATYMSDYIPEAIGFLSGASPVGMYQRSANRLKDEVFLRLVSMLKGNHITVTDDVANRRYPIVAPLSGNVSYVTFKAEFLEECAVVLFEKTPSGRNRLISKKEMKKLLGRGRSTDVLDAVAMRMLPVLKYEYGSEFEKSAQLGYSEHHASLEYGEQSIYEFLSD